MGHEVVVEFHATVCRTRLGVVGALGGRSLGQEVSSVIKLEMAITNMWVDLWM